MNFKEYLNANYSKQEINAMSLEGLAARRVMFDQMHHVMEPCIHEDCDGMVERDCKHTNMCAECYETIMEY